MELIKKTITEIVSEHNSAAEVFDKYHLDFCCCGDRTLKEAVAEANIAVDFLLEDLELMGPVRLSEVEDVQKEILQVAINLAADGTIALGGKGGEEYV